MDLHRAAIAHAATPGSRNPLTTTSGRSSVLRSVVMRRRSRSANSDDTEKEGLGVCAQPMQFPAAMATRTAERIRKCRVTAGQSNRRPPQPPSSAEFAEADVQADSTFRLQ